MAKRKAPRRHVRERSQEPRRRTARRIAKQLSPAFKNFQRRLGDVVDAEEEDRFALGALWNELNKRHYAEKELGQLARDWWKAHVGSPCDVRSAKRLGRVVRRWPKKEVMIAWGEARLDLLISYCRHRFKVPEDPGPFPIDFKDPSGNAQHKPFSDCSEQEMEWAVRPPGHSAKKTKKTPPPPPPPMPPDDDSGPITEWEAVFLESLHDTLWKIGEGPRVGSGVFKEYDGKKLFFSIRKIDLHHIREVSQALLDAIDATLAPRPPWQDPMPMPPPDWLKPRPKSSPS